MSETTNEAVLTSAPPSAPQAAALVRAYEWIAHRELLACATVLILTLGIRAALLPWFPPPIVNVHDEFSYLLAADTFASGRVANPPHPMWQHFETFHELMQPVYASKYPAMQGLILAFGQKFFGNPWVGVVLSCGLMCAAICWMLQGWLTPNFAFLGALLFVLRVGVLSYWMNSYWGGAAAAVGGSLVLGALPRLWRGFRTGYLAVFALGLAILMHSRPWEGAILGMASLGVLLWIRKGLPSLRVAAPALAILVISVGAMAFLNYRLTGSPLTFPHALYEKQYQIVPMFSFLPLHPEPVYHTAVIRDFNLGWEVDHWRLNRTNALDGILGKVSQIYDFFFGFWPLLIPPLLWPYPLKTREERVAAFLLVLFLVVAVFPLSGFAAHYAAPIAGLLYVRFLQTLSRLFDWRPAGKPIGFAVVVFFLTLFVYQFGAYLSMLFHGGTMSVPGFAVARNSIAQQLAKTPGRQLVLVRYGSKHDPQSEWVWNRADIDGAQTVWAHSMNLQQDSELLDYYRSRQPDRKVWTLDADEASPNLAPYTEKETQR